MRLLNNNIVISSLLSWFKDFRSIQLLEFKNIKSLLPGENEAREEFKARREALGKAYKE